MPSPRIRLSDVAKLAGVSTATVSAVINNQVGHNIRVSAETQQAVWEAVTRLGYVANPAARTLAGGQNKILGIFTYEPIFPFQHHDFFHPFLLGIEEEAEKQGYNLLLFTNVTNENGQRSIYHEETNLLYLADGTILLGLNENKEELRRLQEGGYPFVYVGRREVPGVNISFTASDYAAGTADLTERMFACGHEQLVFVTLPRTIESAQDRETGFIRAYQQRGLPLPEISILKITPEYITPQVVKTLLARGVTGALVEHDALAYAFRNALHQLDLDIPTHFSVGLLGDPHHTWEDEVKWSMFSVPRREMGIHAVRILVERLNNPANTTAQTIYLPCTQIAGQTIASPQPNPYFLKEVPA